jgi:CheY-like chemotaxis protein
MGRLLIPSMNQSLTKLFAKFRNQPIHQNVAEPQPVQLAQEPVPLADAQPLIPTGKILVVDDNNLEAKVISFKLRAGGYLAVTAQDGAEAISAARKEEPDLILLDINFPPGLSGAMGDGVHIMEWLHRLDATRGIPIIVITSSEDLKEKERALTAGAAAFFRKPINHDELHKAIQEILSTPKEQ